MYKSATQRKFNSSTKAGHKILFLKTFQQLYITGILIVLYVINTSMKLPAMLLKAGLASAGAGIYLYFNKLFKSKKQTKKEPAKNLKTTKSVKNPAIKPRKKRTAAIKN